jgi:hypothetical protein
MNLKHYRQSKENPKAYAGIENLTGKILSFFYN